MATLTRYQKPGGFIQLVSLIEGFGPQKREKYLDIVEKENRLWAVVLREKLLSVERIMTWDFDSLRLIFHGFQPLHLAAFLHGLAEEDRGQLLETLSSSKKKETLDLYSYMKPSLSEISSMFIKVISEARKLVREGQIRLEEVDKSLLIPDDIEERIKEGDIDSFSKTGSMERPKEDQNKTVEIEVIRSMPKSNVATLEHDPQKRIANLKDQVVHLKKQLQTAIKQNQNLSNENAKLKILLKDYLKESA